MSWSPDIWCSFHNGQMRIIMREYSRMEFLSINRSRKNWIQVLYKCKENECFLITISSSIFWPNLLNVQAGKVMSANSFTSLICDCRPLYLSLMFLHYYNFDHCTHLYQVPFPFKREKWAVHHYDLQYHFYFKKKTKKISTCSNGRAQSFLVKIRYI